MKCCLDARDADLDLGGVSIQRASSTDNDSPTNQNPTSPDILFLPSQQYIVTAMSLQPGFETAHKAERKRIFLANRGKDFHVQNYV
jgi:hypothetical protein